MNTALSPNVPANPSQLYRNLRAENRDHDRAVTEVQHSFGRRDLDRVLERARLEWEALTPELPEPVQEVQPVPDAFTAAEQTVRERIAELQTLRGPLALGSP